MRSRRCALLAKLRLVESLSHRRHEEQGPFRLLARTLGPLCTVLALPLIGSYSGELAESWRFMFSLAAH